MRRVLHRWLVALALAGCDADPPAPAQSCAPLVGSLTGPARGDRLAVVGVAPFYASGRAMALSLADWSWRALPVEATGDTVVRPLGGALAFLHRAAGVQDNLTLWRDDAAGAAVTCQVRPVTDDEARGARRVPYANLHDALAVDAGTVYVTRHNMSSVAVVDVAAGRVARVIDLLPYRGAAEGAWPDALARVGDEVWVTLGRHDNLERPTAPGAIARIDPRTHAVTGVVELPHGNPYGAMHASDDGARVYVAAFGSYNAVGDGAVEVVDVASRRALAPLVTEAELGGNVDALAVVDARRVAVRVSAERRGTGALEGVRVVLYDHVARTTATLSTPAVWGAAGPLRAGPWLVVPDPGTGAYHQGAGLRVFTREGREARAIVPMGVSALMPYDVRGM